MFHYYHSGCRRQNVKLAIGNAHICDNVIHVPNIYEWMNEWMRSAIFAKVNEIKCQTKEENKNKIMPCRVCGIQLNAQRTISCTRTHTCPHTKWKRDYCPASMIQWNIERTHTYTHALKVTIFPHRLRWWWRWQWWDGAADDDVGVNDDKCSGLL